MSDRLLFKFYKSYFDVASELNDKDRLAFYDALMSKEFYNIEPDLKGMAKFAYISQKHSIDKQVEGWESKMKSQLNTPIQGGTLGGIAGGAVQEKEKEKEKEKEQIPPTPKGSEIDFDKLLKLINHCTGKNLRIINGNTKKKFIDRLKEGYSKEDILRTIKNASKDSFHVENDFKWLTPEYFSRAATLDKFSSTISESPKQQKQIPAGVWNV